MKGKVSPIKSADVPSNVVVLGTFEGECADSNITNLNGLDITREVWETVFNSDDYKKAIDAGWYLGYLGHPEDPNCMNFSEACIKMTEGHIADDGKIYGKFDLIDTPVGRIVKTFIDAGVKFGISVRGAGDIIDNSVDPDSFVFRGFDLVSFPAYPDSIPTFTEIAASTDAEKQQKYKAICAAVNKNLDGLKTKEAVEIVQSQFAKQSEEYKKLEDRKNAITASQNDTIDLTEDKLDCMVQMYVSASKELEGLKSENNLLKRKIASMENNQSRRVKAIERISAAQVRDLEESLHSVTSSYHSLKSATNRVKDENTKLQDSNLKYKQRVEAATNLAKSKDAIISELRVNLSETVKEVESAKSQASNRDETIKRLESKVQASTALIKDYQDAFATLYANAIGVSLKNVKVTASTSVQDLRSMIGQSAGRSNITADSHLEIADVVDDYNESDLVTL